MLRHHVALARACEDPDLEGTIASMVGEEGLGVFVRSFLLAADDRKLARFLRGPAVAPLIASQVLRCDPHAAAALVTGRYREALADVVARLFSRPHMGAWGARLVAVPGTEAWVATFCQDPRGAAFARQVLLSKGYADWVEKFLRHEDGKAFVMRLLQQPGMTRFVTWLNHDYAMCRWFAEIAARETTIDFIMDMLMTPGLDRLITSLLLRPGNSASLKTILEHWVRAERSLGKVISSWAERPRAAKGLARLVISPGFLDGVVLQRLLLQPGLAKVVVEAMLLLGARGLRETVLPLAVTTLATAASITSVEALGVFEGLDTDLGAFLGEVGSVDMFADGAMAILAIVLST